MNRGEERRGAATIEGIRKRLDQHFLDQFVYSGLPRVKLSDSLFAPPLPPPLKAKTI